MTNGKGDRDRTQKRDKYRNQYDRIFRKRDSITFREGLPTITQNGQIRHIQMYAEKGSRAEKILTRKTK